MGRLKIDWEEDVDTLKGLYLAEKDHQGRMRLQALWYLRQGYPIAEAAERIGKPDRTIQNWVAWYRRGGLEEVLSRRQGGSTDRERRWSPEQEQELKGQAQPGKIRPLWEGVHWAQQPGVHYRYWGMRKVFDRLELRKKRPRPRNPQAPLAEQERWKKGGSRSSSKKPEPKQTRGSGGRMRCAWA